MTEIWEFLKELAANIGLVFLCLIAFMAYYNKHRF